LLLVGMADSLQAFSHERVTIVAASEVVAMDDPVEVALRKKKDSSMRVAIQQVKDGSASVAVSAGNTGALMAIARYLLKTLDGIDRPAIATQMPNAAGGATTVLDLGANVDCSAEHLLQFAVMGSALASVLSGRGEPTVGLLNIGEEATKGTEPILQTHALLSESTMNFIGNVEGRDVLAGTADVVICDGFVGNIVLKFAESMLGLLKAKIKGYAAKSIVHKIMVLFMLIPLKKILKDFDYQEYGGVPLLGVNGVVIIGHGKSSPLAIQNMLTRAVEVIRGDVNGSIKQALVDKKD
jgi:glycerol-3-phosphate acyltransferase PlsX